MTAEVVCSNVPRKRQMELLSVLKHTTGKQKDRKTNKQT